MQQLEQRMSQLLGTAGKSMPGQWLMHFTTDNEKNAAINATQHNGRTHEFRCSLSMEYVANKTALTLYQTKEPGAAAPFYTLFLGAYNLTNKNGKQILEENFGEITDCCDARTMMI